MREEGFCEKYLSRGDSPGQLGSGCRQLLEQSRASQHFSSGGGWAGGVTAHHKLARLSCLQPRERETGSGGKQGGIMVKCTLPTSASQSIPGLAEIFLIGSSPVSETSD